LQDEINREVSLVADSKNVVYVGFQLINGKHEIEDNFVRSEKVQVDATYFLQQKLVHSQILHLLVVKQDKIIQVGIIRVETVQKINYLKSIPEDLQISFSKQKNLNFNQVDLKKVPSMSSYISTSYTDLDIKEILKSIIV